MAKYLGEAIRDLNNPKQELDEGKKGNPKKVADDLTRLFMGDAQVALKSLKTSTKGMQFTGNPDDESYNKFYDKIYNNFLKIALELYITA